VVIDHRLLVCVCVCPIRYALYRIVYCYCNYNIATVVPHLRSDPKEHICS